VSILIATGEIESLPQQSFGDSTKSTAFNDLLVPTIRFAPSTIGQTISRRPAPTARSTVIVKKRQLSTGVGVHEASTGHILRHAQKYAQGDSPMNKALEVLLTVVALAGLYSAILTSASPPDNSANRVQQAVVVADGSDPMPLCRGKGCR
jgi:hypothetical protein